MSDMGETTDDDDAEGDNNNDDLNYDLQLEEDYLLHASALGLNHIRTCSVPSPLRIERERERERERLRLEVRDFRRKKVSWSQSKSLRVLPPTIGGLEGNAAISKEMQSPRFQAILRATSGLKKRASDLKSYSHEFNSKGARPLPFSKSRGFGRVEEILVMLRGKFDKLKEEVDTDLGIFAGDLVSILEETSVSHQEWQENLEDLLIIARKCAKMAPSEFWLKCENIVQILDDRRQDLPTGILKQVHTRLLFILTRCTRLVQFHKECGYEEGHHVLGLHQLSDLSVYHKVLESTYQSGSSSLGETEANETQIGHNEEQNQAKLNVDDGVDHVDVSTAKSAAPSTSSFRTSSCMKFSSTVEKNLKGHDEVDTQTKDVSDRLDPKEDQYLTTGIPVCTPGDLEMPSDLRRVPSEASIHKLLEIARSVANINTNEYSALEIMLDHLTDLKFAIQDRKADALENCRKREKYVLLCGQIDDDKIELSSNMANEDSSVDDETVRSLRASPVNTFSKDRTTIEDFEIIKPISRGAFGRVFLAKKRATGDVFAIKVLKKADMIRKNAVESILAERDILISVRNPFVFLNGGDLFSLLRTLGCLEENMARVYIAEVVLALEYLHSLNIIHRDMKPDNLLIGHDGHIKLTDFGLSKVGLINSTEDLSGTSGSRAPVYGENEVTTENGQKQSVVGTPDYLAPEILLGVGHGATADWWSVGVILFELLVGIPPFNAESPQQVFANIMNRDIPWPKVPDEMSYEAYDLINQLLTENPVQRLGATGSAEVKTHPFFRNIHWDTLARQKATFIPSAEALDTSYFMSRYIWNPEDEQVDGGSDFDDMSDTGSTFGDSSYGNMLDEEGDECGNLAEFGASNLNVNYSFSNFSFKNLSQLASINYDVLVKSAQDSIDGSKP
ncbi:hypothetical protein M8C21_010100 [Ambrosia artemisiifolia]|uniref:non-specific serine/threonine protein kinase n=1 Tax=Ambrosia artemisiifolia TaxID=4212 RepID=A0AAD5GL30_AMBAR|nr:hypothetical protein M8C21_010100 [Ambrosia artemisiifolia]